jgi:hypothetical protein
MKLGMIFESGPQGAEKQVCEYLARQLRADITISSATHRNKVEMIADCGKDVKLLMGEGCDRILIIWDLFPPWRKAKDKPCRKADRAAIINALALAEVEDAPVFLICVREELEAWMLADGRAVSAVLSTPAHPVTGIENVKNPDHYPNPKGRMKRLFRIHHRGEFNDLIHAIKIIKAAGLNRLRRSASFRRFEEKLTQ